MKYLQMRRKPFLGSTISLGREELGREGGGGLLRRGRETILGVHNFSLGEEEIGEGEGGGEVLLSSLLTVIARV